MKSIVATLLCASLAAFLGGCFYIKGQVFDPAKGEKLPLESEKLVCKPGVLMEVSDPEAHAYEADMEFAQNSGGIVYDLTQVFEKMAFVDSSSDTDHSLPRRRTATMHELTKGVYASVESFSEEQLISLARVDDRSIAFVMPGRNGPFGDIVRRLNIRKYTFPDMNPTIGLIGSPESIALLLKELAERDVTFDSYIACRAG